MFEIVEKLANSPIWLGLCGFGLIIVPILGIQHVHRENRTSGTVSRPLPDDQEAL
jgi:hypothetical protein